LIVLDTNVLLYALGTEHPAREPSRRIVAAIDAASVRATTTIEVIQEFAHVYARRRTRREAAQHARSYGTLLSPLLVPAERELDDALRLFERHPELGSFDALLAATAIANGADALVSADRAFARVPRLQFVELGNPALDELLVGA